MDKDLKEAIEMFEKIENNPELKALYDAHFKQVTDEANRLETARQEAREEARQNLAEKLETMTKRNQMLLKLVLEAGVPIEEIEKELGYDLRKYL